MTQETIVTKTQELIYEMRVEKVMVTRIIAVAPDDRMCDLQDLLRENKISGLPVIENNQLVGLVSIEDFVRCLVSGKIDNQVREWMTQDVKTLYESDPLVLAVKEFDRWGYGRFPVVNRQTKRLVGIITKGDIVQGLLKKIERDYHRKENAHTQPHPFFQDIVSNNAVITFHYDIIGKDFDLAGETSSNLKKALRKIGIPPSIARRVGIATYEAEMNIVIFTNGGELIVRINPEKIAVEAVDSGPGIFDIKKAMEPGYSTAPDFIRELGFGAGMGLCNIKKCSDDMRLESTIEKGTRLNFFIYLNGESESFDSKDRAQSRDHQCLCE